MNTQNKRLSSSSTTSSLNQLENNSTRCPTIPSEKVSDDERLEVWMACLNILYDTNSFYERLDSEKMNELPNSREIVNFSDEVADRVDGSLFIKASIRFEISRIIRYHCGETQTEFDPLVGWHDLLEPIIYLKGSEVLKYQIFKAILKRYIPQGDNYISILRCLLAYHDPQLYMFFQSKGITLQDYPFTWINRLFAPIIRPPMILTIWDRYFIEKNRFLIFFLSTALIITFRDKIMNYTDEDEDSLIFQLQALPININAENLSDLFTTANSLKMETPVSLINRLCPVIFDNKKDEYPLLDTSSWSITVEELMKSMEKTSRLSDISKNIKFFIIDCRSQEEFDAGHLPTAYFLDYTWSVVNPIKFEDSIEELFNLQIRLFKSNIRARHLCFIGSGREEDQKYTNMVIRKCHRKNIKYVNLLMGGYKALHEHFGSKVNKYFINHNAQHCIVCKENAPPVTVSKLERLKSQGEEILYRLRTSKSTYVMDEEIPGPSRMVKSKSMYENPHTSISKWLKDPNLVTYSDCVELDSSNNHHDCKLIITRDYLIVLRKMSDREDAAKVSVKRPLKSIDKIKTNIKNKNIIVIKYNETSKANDLVINNRSEFLFSDSVEAMRFFSGEYFRTLLMPYFEERLINQT